MAYNPTKGNPYIREQVLTKCWQFLLVNFDKFTEANKIKIALALSTKNIPQEIEGLTTPEVRVVIVRANADSDNAAEKRTDIISERLEGSTQALAG